MHWKKSFCPECASSTVENCRETREERNEAQRGTLYSVEKNNTAREKIDERTNSRNESQVSGESDFWNLRASFSLSSSIFKDLQKLKHFYSLKNNKRNRF